VTFYRTDFPKDYLESITHGTPNGDVITIFQYYFWYLFCTTNLIYFKLGGLDDNLGMDVSYCGED
jgi:hypothetical protein